MLDLLNPHPGQRHNSRRNLGNNNGHRGTAIRAERTTAIEAEPTDP